MPEIKVQHVVSCSCADKNNPAENLLKAEGSHKWKTTGQPKNAVVVLQFEKATEIQSVDIGNEGSAFVEILVGRETATADHDYKVLLVASSFMTPLESRNNTNRNSVRMFGLDKLSNAVSSEKWDRVKIVCTQPFNKSTDYGLSFIKFHSTPTAGDSKKDEGTKKLGAFTIKPEAGDDISSGALFAKKKAEPAEKPPPTGAAAVRAASRLADESVSSPKVEKQVKATPSPAPNKRKHKEDSDEDDKPSTSGTPVPSLKKQSTSLSSTASSNKSESAPPLKKTKSEPPKESPAKAFGKIMEGVVFAMSGFQNPYRGELRQKAIDMGAVYKPDWGKGCTHLICAFSNTPKYNAVRGKGRIVRKDWILQCHKQKKLLPWKKFRLGDAETPDEDSTEDEDEYIPKKKLTKKADSPPPKKPPPKQQKASKYMSDSGEDTEEEIRKVKANIEKDKTTPKKTPKKTDDDDIYNASTDEDVPSTSKKISPKKESPVKNGDDGSDSGFPELPDFFRKKHFLLYGELNEKTKRSMIRYITAYDGELEEYMSDKVHFVVTNSEWDQNFDDALADNPSLIFVKPIWVAKCHDKSKFVPYQPYVVVPSESD